MKVANPIYDAVFKSLMEDLEISKELIGRLINAHVVELTPLPQEVTRLAPAVGIEGVTLRYFRLDYAAVIESPDLANEASTVDATKYRNTPPPGGPGRRKVLIELQRAMDDVALVRFRNFLSKHYAVPVPKRRDSDNREPREIPEVLPIITIYLLGFNVIEARWPIIDIGPMCQNRVTGDPLKEPESQFIRALNHQSIIVQLRNLSEKPTTALENALSLFNQQYAGEDDRRLIVVPEWMLKLEDPLLKMMLRCLEKLSVDAQTREEMDAEDTAWSLVERLQHQTAIAEKAMETAGEERRQKEEAQQREREERLQKEEERRQKEEAQQELERVREVLRRRGVDLDGV